MCLPSLHRNHIVELLIHKLQSICIMLMHIHPSVCSCSREGGIFVDSASSTLLQVSEQSKPNTYDGCVKSLAYQLPNLIGERE